MTRSRPSTDGQAPTGRSRAGAGVVAAVAAGLIVAGGAGDAAAQTEPAPASTVALPAVPELAPAAPVPAPVAPVPSTLAAPAAVAPPTTTATTPAPPAKGDGPATLDDDTIGSDAGGVGRDDAGKARRARERREARAALARKHAREARRRKADAAKAKEREEAAREQAADDARAAVAATPAGGSASSSSGAPAPGMGDDAALGAVPAAIPGLFIARFRIPPFLLPIYQAAGMEYGIRWEVLAAINEIETDYGRNLNVSTAGALGWMQFMPATWKAYGVDADGDGTADPMNPVDAIFAAARYLKAAGAEDDIRRAVFAYNHANWYVDSVMLRARLIGGLPDPLVGSLTGLTQARLPADGAVPEAGTSAAPAPLDEAAEADAATTPVDAAADPDAPVWSARRGDPRAAQIAAVPGTEVVAVQDGTVIGTGDSETMGRWIRLRDVFGNRYTYSHLGAVEETYAVPVAAATDEETGRRPAKDPVPTAPATAGLPGKPAPSASGAGTDRTPPALRPPASAGADASRAPLALRPPILAHPARATPTGRVFGDLAAQDPSATPVAPVAAPTPRSRVTRDADGGRVVVRPLRRGSRVTGGTVLGTIGTAEDARDAAGARRGGKAASGADRDVLVPGRLTGPAIATSTQRATMAFSVRPAGRGAPRIDPRPILDGWRLLSATTPRTGKAKSALFGTNAGAATAGQVLLLPKERLEALVLADDRLTLPEAGRAQIRAGAIDRRVLATLAYLSANGHRIVVSSLRRPGSITSSGNVSEHDSGNAVDIAAVDGVTITPSSQGPGSVTERTIRLLLGLQGAMTPHQIISLMTPADFGGAANVLAMGDHDDHIHVGFRTAEGDGAVLGRQLASALKPAQWGDLIDRLREIDNPEVSTAASPYAVKVKARKGE